MKTLIIFYSGFNTAKFSMFFRKKTAQSEEIIAPNHANSQLKSFLFLFSINQLQFSQSHVGSQNWFSSWILYSHTHQCLLPCREFVEIAYIINYLLTGIDLIFQDRTLKLDLWLQFNIKKKRVHHHSHVMSFQYVDHFPRKVRMSKTWGQRHRRS